VNRRHIKITYLQPRSQHGAYSTVEYRLVTDKTHRQKRQYQLIPALPSVAWLKMTDTSHQPMRDLHVQTAPCWVDRGWIEAGHVTARSTAPSPAQLRSSSLCRRQLSRCSWAPVATACTTHGNPDWLYSFICLLYFVRLECMPLLYLLDILLFICCVAEATALANENILLVFH